jgi:hypothetical protein
MPNERPIGGGIGAIAPCRLISATTALPRAFSELSETIARSPFYQAVRVYCCDTW